MPRLGHFTPEKDPLPVVQEAGRATFWSGGERKTSPHPQFDPRTIQSVATRYTYYAISAQGTGGCYCMLFRRRYGVAPNGRRYHMICELVVPFVCYEKLRAVIF